MLTNILLAASINIQGGLNKPVSIETISQRIMQNNGALIFLQNFLVRRRTAAFLHITSWRWDDSIPTISSRALLISSVMNRSFQGGGFGLALRPPSCLFGRGSS